MVGGEWRLTRRGRRIGGDIVSMQLWWLYILITEAGDDGVSPEQLRFKWAWWTRTDETRYKAWCSLVHPHVYIKRVSRGWVRESINRKLYTVLCYSTFCSFFFLFYFLFFTTKIWFEYWKSFVKSHLLAPLLPFHCLKEERVIRWNSTEIVFIWTHNRLVTKVIDDPINYQSKSLHTWILVNSCRRQLETKLLDILWLTH